jgi:hypothetical protein
MGAEIYSTWTEYKCYCVQFDHKTSFVICYKDNANMNENVRNVELSQSTTREATAIGEV